MCRCVPVYVAEMTKAATANKLGTNLQFVSLMLCPLSHTKLHDSTFEDLFNPPVKDDV